MTIGVILWGVLSGAFVTLEAIGFIDGKAGLPTASQLVKKWKRQSAAHRILLTALLAVAAPILYLHWVVELF